MNMHLRTITRNRPAMAQDGDGIGFNFDLVGFLQFIITILAAVDGLLMRKNEQQA